MKPTTIRGTTLKPGDSIYFIMNTVASLGARLLTDADAIPKIDSRTIVGTNGTSFAFVKGNGIWMPKGHYAYVDTPGDYCVTLAEAEAELAAEMAKVAPRVLEQAEFSENQAKCLAEFAVEARERAAEFQAALDAKASESLLSAPVGAIVEVVADFSEESTTYTQGDRGVIVDEPRENRIVVNFGSFDPKHFRVVA